METRLPDQDLKYALEYNPQDGFDLSQIKTLLACIPGANDEYSWHWVVSLEDGRYAYIQASCDYTGWDCQSSADYTITTTAEKEASLTDDDYGNRKGSIAPQLLKQLKGEQPYGVWEGLTSKE